jgi:hypothetical protein
MPTWALPAARSRLVALPFRGFDNSHSKGGVRVMRKLDRPPLDG